MPSMPDLTPELKQKLNETDAELARLIARRLELARALGCDALREARGAA